MNCACGCGGIVKSRRRFILGHNSRTRAGKNYAVRKATSHPRAGISGCVHEHILIAERALGKFLPPKAVVHHTDEKKGHINPLGLVICPDDAYHKLLHRRSRALVKCGHADWRKCKFCKQYDSPDNLRINASHVVHPECQRLYMREWHAENREDQLAYHRVKRAKKREDQAILTETYGERKGALGS